MATQKADHSLESILLGHNMYKYIWTPCHVVSLNFVLSQLAHRTDFSSCRCGECARIVSYYAVSVIKDARWWATCCTKNQLLCHDCRFHVTPWKLRIACYRYTVTWLRCKAHPPNQRCLKRDKSMRLTDEYVLNKWVIWYVHLQ